jgi:hypothetical protein
MPLEGPFTPAQAGELASTVYQQALAAFKPDTAPANTLAQLDGRRLYASSLALASLLFSVLCGKTRSPFSSSLVFFNCSF